MEASAEQDWNAAAGTAAAFDGHVKEARPLYAKAKSPTLVTARMPVTLLIEEQRAKAFGGMSATSSGTWKLLLLPVHVQEAW